MRTKDGVHSVTIGLWNVKETSKATGLSVWTIYSWVSQKRIPYVKLGNSVRFDPKDIEAWIESQKVKEMDLWTNRH